MFQINKVLGYLPSMCQNLRNFVLTEMKRQLFCLVLACLFSHAQAQLWGDMNADGKISVVDLAVNVEEEGLMVNFQDIVDYILEINVKDGYHFVDLGLPSGTMWSTKNLDGYYAWGEITPKSSYDWNTYLWANGLQNRLNKYCSSNTLWGEYIDMDERNTLEADDDVAQQQWSSNWNIPSLKQWEELESICKWTWTSFAGVQGYRVKGPNGHSIFLPVTGFYSGKTKRSTSEGHYWSNNTVPSMDNYAYEMVFSATRIDEDDINQRSVGSAIRPVTTK